MSWTPATPEQLLRIKIELAIKALDFVRCSYIHENPDCWKMLDSKVYPALNEALIDAQILEKDRKNND